jgi:cytochrome P450
MTIAHDVYYDPYDVGIVHDPYPVYARLREEAPIYYNERYDFWAISRYADVEKALANWETFSNSRGDILELIQSNFDMPKGVMMMEDPPVHTMLRGLMSRVFTPRRMAEIEDQIRAYCVNCLDPHVGSDGFDIIAELASMMPCA